MYALKVQVNNETPVVAGASDLGVLNAIINCIGKLGESTREAREGEELYLALTLGGLTARQHGAPDEHLRWASNRPLHIGDSVCVQIIETDSVDAPGDAVEAEKRKHDEREYFDHCKKVYFDLRDKYEG